MSFNQIIIEKQSGLRCKSEKLQISLGIILLENTPEGLRKVAIAKHVNNQQPARYLEAFIATLALSLTTCLLNIKRLFSPCVFQLYVRGAHGQGLDGKSAPNFRELRDEFV